VTLNLPSQQHVRVCAEGIKKHYNRRLVLRDVDLHVASGEIVVIVGPNASGKTTLLDIVTAFVPQDEGMARVDGSIGYAPQRDGLVDHLLPKEHFLLFGRGYGFDRATSLNKGQILAERLVWDATTAPVVGELSAGTRQKLNIVLAALGDADVMVMDEPCQALDVESARRFWDLASCWRSAGKAVLIAAHAHDPMIRADTIVELSLSSRRHI
jgi:ABC-2 type transport system ATP-binding protein